MLLSALAVAAALHFQGFRLARATTPAEDPFLAPASPFGGSSSARLPDDPAQEARMPRVSAQQLHALMLRHQGLVVVDARDAYSYAASHIPGALDFPLLQFGRQYRLLPKDELIALYCT